MTTPPWIRIKGTQRTAVVQWCSMNGGWVIWVLSLFSWPQIIVYIRGAVTQGPISPSTSSTGRLQRHLSLLSNYNPMLSAGHSDAEAPWWIQECWGYKWVSSGVGPYIHTAHTHMCTPPHPHSHTHTHTHTHPCWRIFPWVSSVSLCFTNSLVIVCRRKKSP